MVSIDNHSISHLRRDLNIVLENNEEDSILDPFRMTNGKKILRNKECD